MGKVVVKYNQVGFLDAEREEKGYKEEISSKAVEISSEEGCYSLTYHRWDLGLGFFLSIYGYIPRVENGNFKILSRNMGRIFSLSNAPHTLIHEPQVIVPTIL